MLRHNKVLHKQMVSSWKWLQLAPLLFHMICSKRSNFELNLQINLEIIWRDEKNICNIKATFIHKHIQYTIDCTNNKNKTTEIANECKTVFSVDTN